MAQDLNHIPNAFLLVAGGVIIGVGLWRWRDTRWAGVGVLVVGSCLLATDLKAEAETIDPGLVLRGREVYIAEGCIHCHSQYIRLKTRDVDRWGQPERVDVSPPLYGNRRQGPDLATLGFRLPVPEWQRAHLIDPRRFNPRSRMPSYAYLFDDDDKRGEALVAYLVSLGRKSKS
jgi:cytochrome c oxidase cbb3-type subunit 2